MINPTMEQYLAYMRAKPRTHGWGALLIYDRFRTNRLLAQEYVERFDENTWLPAINMRTETETGSFTVVNDLIFDKPRLSFANSSLAGSKARLSMNALGGSLRMFRRVPGSAQEELVDFAEIDPLSGPAVRMTINLNATDNGSVSEGGRVTLDLADAESYSFEISAWKEMNEKVGVALQKKFAELPVEQRVWELNTLAPVEGELNPTSFEVRTHSLAGTGEESAVANEEELVEGAVVVGVAFNNETPGSLPGDNKAMAYMLPVSDEGEPFSANIVLANDLLMNDIARKVGASPEITEPVKLIKDQAGFYTIIKFGDTPTSIPRYHQTFPQGEVRWGWKYYELKHEGFELADPDEGFRLVLKDDELTFSLKGQAKSSIFARFYWSAVIWKETRDMIIDFDFQRTYRFELDAETEKVVLVASPATEELTVEPDDEPGGFNLAFGPFVDNLFYPELKRLLTDKFQSLTKAIEAAAIEFDLFRLNGLLFRGNEIVHGDLIQMPGDLSLLGELAPDKTAFAVEPDFHKMIVGATQAFTLNPAPADSIQWSAKRLPGETGNAGTFEGNVYTAPAATDILGTHLRVIITGTVGTRSSSTLVTVVPNSVAVFPFLFQAQYSLPDEPPAMYVVVGGSLDAGLIWSQAPGFKGRVRAVTDADRKNPDLSIPTDQEVRIYESPKKTGNGDDFFDKRIHVDRIEVSDGVRKAGIDVVVPWTIATAAVRVEKLEEGAAQLVLWLYDESVGEEVALPPDETTWRVLRGGGELDVQTGIYYPAPDEQYAIIVGGDKMEARNPGWAYVLLPVHYCETATAKLTSACEQTRQREEWS